MAKQKLSASGKSRKQVRQHVTVKRPAAAVRGSRPSPPRNAGAWKADLALIKRLRARRDAPVDTVGCERLADPRARKADFEWQCLVSAMLSSQTRDQANAEAMAKLHKHGNTVQRIAATKEAQLAKLISAVGFYNMKAKTLRGAALICRDKHRGRIPQTLEGLMELPGIGPKMAHLIMHAAFDRQQGICVDTHVHRIANLLGWIRTATPEETRESLESLLPRREWKDINVLMVGLGQMQQQAAPQLIERCVASRQAEEALRLVKRIGLSLRPGRCPALDAAAAKNPGVRRLLEK
eukprot:gb/GFBE01041996.1/.p1 GENE.gb/GFBE01041996.1/~~gb/GFBE01041996.1/.p1  ORF type:complete len:294 (+),score=57.37 gb/GFBE01041996.1/:1-882(+)